MHIMLDADGTHDLGNYILVCAQTGIVYGLQCAGYATDFVEQEGFLVSVGPFMALETLDEWFANEFSGHCHTPKKDWTPERTLRLEELISEISCWKQDETGKDLCFPLALDRSRIGECVEAWIPVTSPYGRAYLLRNNSD